MRLKGGESNGSAFNSIFNLINYYFSNYRKYCRNLLPKKLNNDWEELFRNIEQKKKGDFT